MSNKKSNNQSENNIFPYFNTSNLQQLSFSQNQFIESNVQPNTSNQTPKFFSEINMEQIIDNSNENNRQILNNLLSGFKQMGVDIQEVLSELQSYQNSQIQEIIDLEGDITIQSNKQIQESLDQSSTFNKSFFFANSCIVKNISHQCKKIKQDLNTFPNKINKFINAIKAIVKEINETVSQYAIQFINRSLQKMREQIDEILKREYQLYEQNQQLKNELIQLSHQYLTLKRQNEDLLKMKKQYECLEVTNQQQFQVIKELQQTLYQLQYKIKQSETQCSTMSSQLRINNIGLQRKYEKALQEMKLTLARQIKTQIFYKLKYGYPLLLQSYSQQNRMYFTNVKLSKSSSFQQINEVINNLKEINSCLLEKSKHR